MSATPLDTFDLYLQQQRDAWNSPEQVTARQNEMYRRWGNSQVNAYRDLRKTKVKLVDLTRPPELGTFGRYFTIDIELEHDMGATFGIVWGHHPEKMLCREGCSEPFIDFDAHLDIIGTNVYIMRDWSPEYEHLREKLSQIAIEVKVKQRMQMLKDIERTQSELEATIQKTQTRLREILELKERCITGIAEAQEKIKKV